MLDSASVNSISSMPSPVYQWRKALRRNMAVNCSATRFITSCMQVELPRKPTDILRPFGGMSQMAHLRMYMCIFHVFLRELRVIGFSHYPAIGSNGILFSSL